MNERIDDFASQCEGETICYCGQTGFNYEKFAELIVKECADIAGCNGHVSGFALSDLIKDYFGVEEVPLK